MKKFIFALIAALAVSVCSVSAEEGGTVAVNDLLKSKSVLVNSEETSLKKNGNGAYTVANVETGVLCFGKMQGIIECDMSFELDSSGGSWIGFELMARDQDKRCWSTACYSVILKSGVIEFQCFGSAKKTGFLGSYEYALPMNERMNVQSGVIPTEKGNYVFVKLGNDVFGVYDSDNAISEEGNFCIEGILNGLTLYDTEVDKTTSIPSAEISYDAKTNSLISDVRTTDAAEPVFNWYLSQDEYIYDEQQKNTDLSCFDYIEEVKTDNLKLEPHELGKYAVCTVETQGLTVYSNICHSNPVDYVLNNGFVGCVGYTKGVVNGKEFEYDPSGNIYPDIYDGIAYIPFRGVMEAYNFPVMWNEETRIVEVYPAEASAEVSFCVDKIGFINFMNRMTASMVKAPMIVRDRTFLDIYSTSYIFDYETVIVDEGCGAIIIAQIDMELDESQIAELADYISGL